MMLLLYLAANGNGSGASTVHVTQATTGASFVLNYLLLLCKLFRPVLSLSKGHAPTLHLAKLRAPRGGPNVAFQVLIAVLLSAAPAEKSKLAVLALTSAGEVDPAVARSLTDLVTAEVAARGYFDPISSSEIETMLGAERQRQLLGCGEDSTSCLTELAGALGAGFMLTGSLAKVGSVFQLNLSVVDTRNARTLGRSSKLARDFESLRMQVPYAVAEACGTPLPPPPSRVLPYTMIGVGAAALIGGGVVGILGLNNESLVRGELAADDTNPNVQLGPARQYRAQLANAAVQKTVALTALIAGAALVGFGIWLVPPEAPQPGQKVGLVLTGNGVAIVGTLP